VCTRRGRRCASDASGGGYGGGTDGRAAAGRSGAPRAAERDAGSGSRIAATSRAGHGVRRKRHVGSSRRHETTHNVTHNVGVQNAGHVGVQNAGHVGVQNAGPGRPRSPAEATRRFLPLSRNHAQCGCPKCRPPLSRTMWVSKMPHPQIQVRREDHTASSAASARTRAIMRSTWSASAARMNSRTAFRTARLSASWVRSSSASPTASRCACVWRNR
jgi:hypothetical protein